MRSKQRAMTGNIKTCGCEGRPAPKCAATSKKRVRVGKHDEGCSSICCLVQALREEAAGVQIKGLERTDRWSQARQITAKKFGPLFYVLVLTSIFGGGVVSGSMVTRSGSWPVMCSEGKCAAGFELSGSKASQQRCGECSSSPDAPCWAWEMRPRMRQS